MTRSYPDVCSDEIHCQGLNRFRVARFSPDTPAKGRIFSSYGKFGFALRLPEGTRAELLENRGGTCLRYFPKGHVKKEYVVIPDEIMADSDAMGMLVQESLQFVQSRER